MFFSSNYTYTYAMEKNNPLMMVDSNDPKLSLFIFAIIVLCASKFNGEKEIDSTVVTDSNFISEIHEFIQTNKDQMINSGDILTLANMFISSVDQYPLSSAIMSSLLIFAKPSIWTKENKQIIYKLLKIEKKPYLDNKALLKQEYQDASLQSTMSNNKQLPVYMVRNMGKNIAKQIGKNVGKNVDTAQKAFQRARVAPTVSKKIAEQLVQ